MRDSIFQIYYELYKNTKLGKHRFLFGEFNLEDRLTGLVGARGVGKTTLLLQYLKTHFKPEQAFYVSADHIFFTQTSLYEFIYSLYQEEGIKTFFIDEIHKYKAWSQELKNLYDGFPDLTIVFSGSSSLDLIKGSYDLSRRAKLFHMPGMSFREYLNLKHDSQIAPFTLKSIIETPHALIEGTSEISHINKHFKDYLKHGFYPFYYEAPLSYHEKLLAIIDKTVFEDIAEFYPLKTSNLMSLRKIVIYLASIPPGTVNTHNLAKNIGVDDKTVLNYLQQMNETGLIRLVYAAEKGNASLRRPEKIFLNNTNLQYALEGHIQAKVDLGSIRELFFIQSLQCAGLTPNHSKKGDYLVDDYTFEVGGKSKTTQQIKGLKNAFLVQDDITLPTQKGRPLWCFGFLY